MDISIAICTWKRNQSLRRTLESLTKLRVPADLQWEVLVTNNCECAETDELLDRFVNLLPLRRTIETRLGLCYARNRAISEVTGEYILWTDDDVLVDSEWLANYWNAISSFPAADFFGGPIDLNFEVPPAAWIAKNMSVIGGAFALIDLGCETRWFVAGESPFGANMAFRRQILQKTDFNTALGPVGNSQIRGDESDLFARLPENCLGVWVGNARVTHCISRERTTFDYLWNYYEGYGRTLVRSNMHLRDSISRPLYQWIFSNKRLFSFPLSLKMWARAMRKAAIATGIQSELKQMRDAFAEESKQLAARRSDAAGMTRANSNQAHEQNLL